MAERKDRPLQDTGNRQTTSGIAYDGIDESGPTSTIRHANPGTQQAARE